MAKNQQFLEQLRALELAPDAAGRRAQLAALDALIEVELNAQHSVNFRAAAVNHQALFQNPGDLFQNVDLTTDAFLTPYNDGDIENNLRQLQRVAAQKRIEFTLASKPLPEQLVVINEVDNRQLRRLLGGPTYSNLAANDLAWNNPDPTLRDGALDEIRQHLRATLTTPITVQANALSASAQQTNVEIIAEIANIQEVAAGAATPLETAAIKKAVADLVALDEKIVELTNHLAKPENVSVLNAAGNDLELERLTALNEQLVRMQANAAAELAARIPRLKELATESAGSVARRVAAAMPPWTIAQLETALAESKKSIEELGNVVALVERSKNAVAIVDVKAIKTQAQFNLLKLEMTLFEKKASDSAAVVQNSLATVNGAPSSVNTFQFQKADLALKDLKQAKDEATKASAEAPDNLTTLQKQALEGRVAALTDQYVGFKVEMESKRQKYAAKANFFMDVSGSMENFEDSLVRRGGKVDADYVSTKRPPRDDTFTSIAQEDAVPVTYKAVRLQPGDVIRSTSTTDSKTPPAPGMPTAKITSTIEQDHTGRVTNKTPDADTQKLTTAAHIDNAFKMAKMLLTSYKPGKGAIVIYGKNAAEVNRVHAAVLLLKEGVPDLKGVEVKAANASGPVRSLLTSTKSSDQAFIQQHLGLNATTHQASTLKEEVKAFAKGTADARKAMAQIKDGRAVRSRVVDAPGVGQEFDKKGSPSKGP